jgi:hypothetical protein
MTNHLEAKFVILEFSSIYKFVSGIKWIESVDIRLDAVNFPFQSPKFLVRILCNAFPLDSCPFT